MCGRLCKFTIVNLLYVLKLQKLFDMAKPQLVKVGALLIFFCLFQQKIKGCANPILTQPRVAPTAGGKRPPCGQFANFSTASSQIKETHGAIP